MERNDSDIEMERRTTLTLKRKGEFLSFQLQLPAPSQILVAKRVKFARKAVYAGLEGGNCGREGVSTFICRVRTQF